MHDLRDNAVKVIRWVSMRTAFSTIPSVPMLHPEHVGPFTSWPPDPRADARPGLAFCEPVFIAYHDTDAWCVSGSVGHAFPLARPVVSMTESICGHRRWANRHLWSHQ